MTKYWIVLIRKTRRAADVTLENEQVTDGDGLFELLQEGMKQLNLSTPVILSKHLSDLAAFHHTRFWPRDFMEPFPYDYMDLFEFLDEDKE